MILEVYITDFMCEEAIAPVETVQSIVDACPELLYAKWQVQRHEPLQTLFNQLQGDGNICSTSSLASAVLFSKKTSSISGTVLCLLPVQLNMQRDSFSLQGIVPLSKAHYQQLTVQISEHFAKDFILHTDPDSRFWWVQPLQTLEVECPWPQSVLFQQAFAWQPTGRDARVLRQWINECQMLMHQIAHHADASWPLTLNSLWFSNVPQLPSWQHRFDLVSGQGRLLEGLTASGLSAVRTLKITELASGQRYKHALFVADSMRDVDWESLSVAFSKGMFAQLKIMLPFAERSVHITLKRSLRWFFWRKPRSMDSLLQALHESLLSQPKPDQGVR